MRIARWAVVTTTLAASAALLLVGCSKKSPYVGKWSGRPTASGPMAALVGSMGESTLDLKEDGTGFAKVGPLPEQQITWEEKDGKLILHASNNGQKKEGDNGLVATPSEDKTTLSVDVGPAKIELKKQAE
jgi:hypothetical protein